MKRDELGKLVDSFGVIVPPTPEQASRARRYVSARAQDEEDQQMLFSMLGLENA